MRKKIFIIFSIVFLSFIAFSSKAFWFEKENERTLVFGDLKEISIKDGGFVFDLKTNAETIQDLIVLEKIEIDEHDLIFPSLEHKIVPGMSVEIHRSVLFGVEVDGKEFEARTFGRTVGDALSDAEIKLNHLDKINYNKDDLIQEGMNLIITRIEIEEIVEEEIIKFKTIEKEDDDLKWKTEKIKQEGENGLKNVRYKITYKNGELVSKEKISTEIIKNPIDKIVVIGTKIEIGDVDKGRASWYAYTGTLACASTKYPKGTWLRVTNRDNGKQVIVQVNDYGPDPGTGKIIDLDSVAFKKIGNLGQGVLDVKVEEILD